MHSNENRTEPFPAAEQPMGLLSPESWEPEETARRFLELSCRGKIDTAEQFCAGDCSGLDAAGVAEFLARHVELGGLLKIDRLHWCDDRASLLTYYANYNPCCFIGPNRVLRVALKKTGQRWLVSHLQAFEDLPAVISWDPGMAVVLDEGSLYTNEPQYCMSLADPGTVRIVLRTADGKTRSLFDAACCVGISLCDSLNGIRVQFSLPTSGAEEPAATFEFIGIKAVHLSGVNGGVLIEINER